MKSTIKPNKPELDFFNLTSLSPILVSAFDISSTPSPSLWSKFIVIRRVLQKPGPRDRRSLEGNASTRKVNLPKVFWALKSQNSVPKALFHHNHKLLLDSRKGSQKPSNTRSKLVRNRHINYGFIKFSINILKSAHFHK